MLFTKTCKIRKLKEKLSPNNITDATFNFLNMALHKSNALEYFCCKNNYLCTQVGRVKKNPTWHIFLEKQD